METDFSAAHSMDTVWFAVDSAGQVGMFDTGETGPAPRRFEQGDLREELRQLWSPAGEEKGDYWDTDFLCSERGLYYFLYPDNYDTLSPLSLYVCSIKPSLPLHIDQLPPDLRYLCREVSFDLNFDQVERFQPLDFVACIPFDPNSVAYLGDDGKTVKPIPGKEKEFAEHLDKDRPDAGHEE